MSPTPFNVLRLGYRRGRDPRITTHLALVSRALGATNFLLAGDEDEALFENVASVNERFGGAMTCEHVSGAMGWLKRFTQHDAGDGEPGVAIHLTMYGEPYREVIRGFAGTDPLSWSSVVPKYLARSLSMLNTTWRLAINLTRKWRLLRFSWKVGLAREEANVTSLMPS